MVQAEARKQILRKHGRCYICLRRGHIGRDCRSHTRCSKCNGRHHVSICERDSKEPTRPPTSGSRTQGSTPASQAAPSDLNPEAHPYTSTSTSTTSCVCEDPRKAVLLQTARARIDNPQKPHNPIEVRILVDSGSQRSYISEREEHNSLSCQKGSSTCLSPPLERDKKSQGPAQLSKLG